MSGIKSKRNGFMKLGQLTQAKGAYGNVSGGYCWKCVLRSRQLFLWCLTDAAFLDCLFDSINAAPESFSGKYLPTVGFRKQLQMVICFWRVSESGEQVLWSRLGHELDLGQDGTGGLAASGLWRWVCQACSNRNGAQLFVSPVLCRCWQLVDSVSDEVKHWKCNNTQSFAFSPPLCQQLRSQLEVLWTGVDESGCFRSVEEDFSIIKLLFPVDSNFQLWQNTWGKMVSIKRKLKCFSIFLGSYFGIGFR